MVLFLWQWSLIQVAAAERMVTAFQDSSTALYAVANSASDSQIYLEALGKGTDGVVLHTDDPAQIYALKEYLRGRREAKMGVRMVKAMVTQVEPVGLGDRVCVDLCNLLQPGEGLLVSIIPVHLGMRYSEMYVGCTFCDLCDVVFFTGWIICKSSLFGALRLVRHRPHCFSPLSSQCCKDLRLMYTLISRCGLKSMIFLAGQVLMWGNGCHAGSSSCVCGNGWGRHLLPL
jgi:hypothetical protein